MDFPKKQQQSLIPKYLLDYTTELQNSHPDPTEDWGGSGSTYEAGTGIDITENVISVDSSVAMKEDIPDVSDFITEDEVDTKLEDYELKSEAFSGDYNDLTNKPTIPVVPTNVSAFTNDAGYITSAALPTNYVTTDTAQTITGIKTFDNDIYLPTRKYIKSNIRGGTLWDKVFYTDDSLINLGNYSAYIRLYSNFRPHLYYHDANYDAVDGEIATLNDIPTVNNNTITITQGGVTKGTFTLNQSSDSTIALDAGGGSSYSAGTGINITNDVISVNNNVAMKTDIPTKTSELTNDSGYITSSALPTNYVTTDTTQNITGEKTFVGSKRIKFKQSTSSDKLGFTLYNYSNNEKGYLEYNSKDDGLYLGRWGDYRVNELGFKTADAGGTHKLLVPNVTLSGTVTDYIPISVNNTKADSSGNISLTIPTVTANGSGTATNTLTKLEVNGTIYDVPSGGQGTTVIANPTLVGTEADLTGLQVGNIKYKVPSGGSGGGGTANLFLHNFKLALQYNQSLTIYLEASLITKSSTQILTVSELISQIAGLQSTAYNDTVIGILFGQHYKSNTSGNKENILGFGLTGSAANPNLYLVVPGGNQTNTSQFWSTGSITKTISWVNNVQNAIGHEITESCSDLVTPAII